MNETELSCQCGEVRLAIVGKPITVAECFCNSCREAARRIEGLPGHTQVVGAHGSTHFVLYRKDRTRIVAGWERLRNFRLGPDRQTRRVIATCCNTPVLLEFKGGHWVSLYGNLWHGKDLPPAQLRTVTSDLADPTVLDDAVPHGRRHTALFFGRLFSAWAAMGFRAPPVALNTPEMELRG
ncbi:MAG TPA: hypothetical protein VIL88_00810 [Devosia sp.]|jgi:hypothetical protein|uniref:GFA family protein n=1 Tax=Devosia sp. TaxID=1871048 RepID=UPI002F927FF3